MWTAAIGNKKFSMGSSCTSSCWSVVTRQIEAASAGSPAVAEQRNATEPWPKRHAKDGRKLGDFFQLRQSDSVAQTWAIFSSSTSPALKRMEILGTVQGTEFSGRFCCLSSNCHVFLFLMMINSAILGHLILEKPYQVRLTQHARPSFAVSSALSVALDIPRRLKDVRCAGSTAEKKTEFRCRPMLWCSN